MSETETRAPRWDAVDGCQLAHQIGMGVPTDTSAGQKCVVIMLNEQRQAIVVREMSLDEAEKFANGMLERIAGVRALFAN